MTISASRKSCGFTLLELLVVVCMVVIAVTVAAPAMAELLTRTRADSYAWQLQEHVHLARNTAITRGLPVTLCPRAGGSQCGNDWRSGYQLFVDRNGNREPDADDEIIQVADAVAERDSLRWSTFQHRTSLQFTRTGTTAHQNGSFVLCVNGDVRFARAVIITKMGRPRLSRDENHDGVHEAADGRSLRC